MMIKNTITIARRLAGSRALSSAGPVTVDTHTHFLPIEWPDFAKRHGGEEWPWMRPNEGGNPQKAMLMQGKTEFRPVDEL